VPLNTIFDEDVVTLDVVIDIVGDFKIVDGVNGGAAIERVVDAVALHVRLSHLSNHMIVNWISTELEGLSDIEEFAVFDSTYDRLIAW
jgi:hypothetical protein